MNYTHKTQRTRIWDLPTRIFHIFLLISVAGLFITSKLEGNAMQLHFLFGYNVLALLLFRLVWGLVGGYWSRFAHFALSPTQLLAYVQSLRRKQSVSHVGHNPLGAISVLSLLTLLLIQVATGLMSDDEITNAGPWSSLVPNSWVSAATQYHTEFGQVILLALISTHIAAVLFYKFIKHDDLITPMLNGDKHVAADTPPSRDNTSSRLLALGIYFACTFVVYRLVQLG